MKISILNTNYVVDSAALKALPYLSLTNGDVRVVEGVSYVWYQNASTGEFLPDDIPANTSGYWKKDLRKLSTCVSFVDNTYDFVANASTDLTGTSYAMQLAIQLGGLLRKDYIYTQLRISDIFQEKTGADNTTKWSNCTNEEKDTIIYYNQMKLSLEGTEDTDKVTYLLSTGQVPDAPSAVAFLKKNHSESIVRGRPAARDRVEGSRMIQAIIKYLTPADTEQLLTTMEAYLRGYKDYLLIGTIIYGDEPGLYDYINSTDIYTGAGLVEEGWTPLTGTLADLKVILNDILFGDNQINI